MKKLALLLVVVLFLSGCATKPGVVSSGPDTYLVYHQGATGLSDFGKLKAEALQEAKEYCLSQNKNIHVVNTSESTFRVFGNLPKAKVQFMCLDKADVE